MQYLKREAPCATCGRPTRVPRNPYHRTGRCPPCAEARHFENLGWWRAEMSQREWKAAREGQLPAWSFAAAIAHAVEAAGDLSRAADALNDQGQGGAAQALRRHAEKWLDWSGRAIVALKPRFEIGVVVRAVECAPPDLPLTAARGKLAVAGAP